MKTLTFAVLSLPFLLLSGCSKKPQSLTLRVTGNAPYANVTYNVNNGMPKTIDSVSLPYNEQLPESPGASYQVAAFGAKNKSFPYETSKVSVEFLRGDTVVHACGANDSAASPPSQTTPLEDINNCQYAIPME